MARIWRAAFLLTPAVLMYGEAYAAGSPVPVARVAPNVDPSTGLELPQRVYRARSGHLLRHMCDRHQKLFCLSEERLPDDWAPGAPLPDGSGAPGAPSGMAPSDVLRAYDIPPGTAAHGQIVAIVDSPDANAFSDLGAYRSAFGLPALPLCTGPGGLPDGKTPCFAQVAEDGSPSTGADGGQGADGETGLDMDMVSAGCPDCSILLVELGQDQDLVAASQTAATLGAVATSISLGHPESTDPSQSGSVGGGAGSGPQGTDPTGFTTPGHLVLAASGDFAFDESILGAASPSYPASAPDVVAVGGTELFDTGSSYDEAVWDDGSFAVCSASALQNGTCNQDVTTSGCSTEFGAPTWQSTVLAGSGCSNRATADISAAANFSGGGIASFSNGQWLQVEGTSAASPLMAGLLTRLGLAATISQNIGWIYEHASAFNDLGSSSYPTDPSGSSTDSQSTSCGILCTVGPGWDGPSGAGTPNGQKLAALASGGAPGGVDAGAPEAGSGNPAPGSGDGRQNGGSDAGGNGGGSSGGVLENGDAGPEGSAIASDPFGPGAASNAGCSTTHGPTGELGGASLILGFGGLGIALSRRRRRA